jgi:putative two-component system response regulator
VSVLIVDDVIGNIRLIEALLAPDGHVTRAAENGAEALQQIALEPPDLVLMDVLMPLVDGFEVCRAIKQNPATRLVPVVLVTSLDDADSRMHGIEAGADDFVTKPFNGQELRARVRSLLRIKHYTDDLDSADSVIVSLAMTIEARDTTTGGHCDRLAASAAMMGRALALDAESIAALRRGGFLHDVGKVGIPDAVLLKPGPLTRDEFALMQQHTVIGDRLCGALRSLRTVRPIVRHHHERLDGTGYPDGLRGDAVPLLAQIISIVDAFDAMTTARPYIAARPASWAAEELLREAARGWRRADLVTAFLEHVARFDAAGETR